MFTFLSTAKVLSILLLLGAVMADVDEEQDAVFKPMAGVDPNTVDCDTEGQIFLLLPHFTECNKFFMCAHGEEVEFSCSGSLIFDFETQTCNWDWAATCTLRIPKDDEFEGSGEEDIGENSESRTAPLDEAGMVSAAIENNNGVLNCHRADSASRQIPYKGDCQRYWKCIDGIPQSAYCSDGLFFNHLNQQCDFEANVQCLVSVEDELTGEFIVYK